MKGVRHIVLVLSGKGGVGKSSVSVQLALELLNQGYKVGLLDIDLCGPSIPIMLGIRGKQVHQSSAGWVPVQVYPNKPFSVMSIGFLLPHEDDPVIWRGPKKTSIIRQFLNDVQWGDLDYLVVDTPPGTSDEHLAVLEALNDYSPDGAVLVTTPQGVALSDVRKELNFCRKVLLPILGVVENMSGFVCPYCSDCSPIFSSGGGKALAEEFNITFLGEVPIDPNLTSCLEVGENYLEKFPDSPATQSFKGIVSKIVEQIQKSRSSVE